jgi:hypothetical protein
MWHGVFGFEARHDAALSPSHLWLAVAFTIAAVGLLRAGIWHLREQRQRGAHLGVGFALSAVLLVSHWYISYGSPLLADYATGGMAVRDRDGFVGVAWTNMTADIAATNGILLFVLLSTLFVLFAMRTLRLGTGAIALMLLAEVLIIVPATNQWLIVPSIVAMALVAELLWLRVRHGAFGGPESWLAYLVIGAVVPLVQTSLHLLALGALGGGVIWTPHLVAGVPIAAAILATAATLLAPPAFLRSPN